MFLTYKMIDQCLIDKYLKFLTKDTDSLKPDSLKPNSLKSDSHLL